MHTEPPWGPHCISFSRKYRVPYLLPHGPLLIHQSHPPHVFVETYYAQGMLALGVNPWY